MAGSRPIRHRKDKYWARVLEIACAHQRLALRELIQRGDNS